MDAFVEAIRNDTPTAVTGYDARVPVVMGLAARRSFEEHSPVSLRDVDPHL